MTKTKCYQKLSIDAALFCIFVKTNKYFYNFQNFSSVTSGEASQKQHKRVKGIENAKKKHYHVSFTHCGLLGDTVVQSVLIPKCCGDEGAIVGPILTWRD